MAGDVQHPGLHLKTFTSLRKKRLALGDASHVIVHKDIVAEKVHVMGLDAQESLERNDPTRLLYNRDAALLMALCRSDRRLRPVYEDEWLVAFRRKAKK